MLWAHVRGSAGRFACNVAVSGWRDGSKAGWSRHATRRNRAVSSPPARFPTPWPRCWPTPSSGSQQFDAKSQASIPAFVPSDFELVYRALGRIQAAQLATGRRFLEWGSGIGVVTCLAAQLGFDAVGIEIEPPLVAIAESLAADHDIDVEFACGSFVPQRRRAASSTRPATSPGSAPTGPDGYAELELEPDDFDVIFAYPWPGEEQVIFDLFADCAAVGALLLTYHGQDGLRLQRKVQR